MLTPKMVEAKGESAAFAASDFKVARGYIDEVTRNNSFITSTVKNEGYYTVGKLVPKNILEKYWV